MSVDMLMVVIWQALCTSQSWVSHHFHLPSLLAAARIQDASTFWYRITQVVLPEAGR